MKRFICTLIMASLTLLCSFAQSSDIKTEMLSYINHLMEQTPGYVQAWNKEVKPKEAWNYIDGVILNSFIQLAHNSETEEEKAVYMNFVQNFVNYFINEEGKFMNAPLKVEQKLGNALDDICESRILFDLLEYSPDSRYETAIETTYKKLISFPRTYAPDGTWGVNFEHKKSYPSQVWLDGMYMYVPFYARYANYTGKLEIFDEIAAQYRFIQQNMRDKKTGLLYHGNDTKTFFDKVRGSDKKVFWADKKTGNSRSFWLRSMGWYIVSLADVIEYIPESKKEVKEELVKYLKDDVASLMKFQDKKTKMFWQVVDKGGKTYKVNQEYLSDLGNKAYDAENKGYAKISNYVESSGSSMIAYACMKGARLGYLDSIYSQKGQEIFTGVYNHSYNSETHELGDICITAGLGPKKRLTRDGSPEYYLAEPVGKNDAKGVGPFIMAFIEYMK